MKEDLKNLAEKDCRTMELIRERTSDPYRVQEDMMTRQDAP
jgi:hypothetical protein